MIAIVIRELTYLKVLAPISDELKKIGREFVLYHFDAPRGSKEYNRATLPKLKIAYPNIVKNAKLVRSFPNDKKLLSQMISDNIKDLVSLEIWMWAKGYIKSLKKHGIKTHSVSYLTDSLWQPKESITTMDRVYYTTEYIMKMHHEFVGISRNPNRDICVGSPVFDCIEEGKCGDKILVMMPNLRAEHVGVAFGSEKNFISIMEKISSAGDLIIKTRKKQWMPAAVRKMGRVVDDGNVMYPPAASKLLADSYCTVMFGSSGIYECIYSGNYVLNVPIPNKRWSWDKKRMNRYFSCDEGSVYQWQCVVDSVPVMDILGAGFEFVPRAPGASERKKWVRNFIGNVGGQSAEAIARKVCK